MASAGTILNVIQTIFSLGGLGISRANDITNLTPWSLHTFRFKYAIAMSEYMAMVELLRGMGFNGNAKKPKQVYEYFSAQPYQVQEYCVTVVAGVTNGDIDLGMIVSAVAQDPLNAVDVLSNASGAYIKQVAETQVEGQGLLNRLQIFAQQHKKMLLGILFILIYIIYRKK